MICLWSGSPGLTVGLMLLQRFRVGFTVECSSCFILVMNRDLYVRSFGFVGRMWDLIESVPDHCLSFYFDSLICRGLLHGPNNFYVYMYHIRT